VKKYCILTNDVELTSLANHSLSEATGKKVYEQGMPALLHLYKKYNVKSTFFYTADIVLQNPDIVKMILADGHEVGCHGWIHDSDKSFDVLSLADQIDHLRKSRELLERVSGKEVISFRAPALRINENTSTALSETGFKIDSSVASQRMDMFLSFGALKKLNWIVAPRLPYFTNVHKLWRKGKGRVFEIPISALVIPYIGTAMRILPVLTRVIRSLLHLENTMNGKPIVFLTHPNEFIDEEKKTSKVPRRSKNPVSYLLGDVLRHKLKLKNLGSRSLELYEREIKYFASKGYEFVTCREYYLNCIKKPT
jgi:peptidoglycan/xylan/chitin deacetylase (PgdA/CDA1 family)